MSPPNHYISRSKTVNETISLIADFRDFVQPGETASAWTVAIEVFTGLDSNPDNMIYQGLSINGVVLEQRFRLGIPGVIYSIKFTLTVNTGNAYELTSRLAVLPDIGGATPVYNIAYETTTLYPYILNDAFSAGIDITGGRLFPAVVSEEAFVTSIALQDSTIVFQQYYYTYPIDAFSSDIFVSDGLLLLQTYIPVNDGPDSFKTAIAVLDGTLTATTLITYDIPYDAISVSITLQDGTLS
jgi:hypothetical protein